jgi:hypothetical protein
MRAAEAASTVVGAATEVDPSADELARPGPASSDSLPDAPTVVPSEASAAEAIPPKELVKPATDAARHDLRSLEAEIQRTLPSLSTLPRNKLTAQLALWAASARALQDQPAAENHAVIAGVFKVLSRARRELATGIVPGLVFAARADWSLHAEVNRALLTDTIDQIPRDRQWRFWEESLAAALSMHHGHLEAATAAEVVVAAAAVLSWDHPTVKRASRRFRVNPRPGNEHFDAGVPEPAHANGEEYAAVWDVENASHR